MLSRRTCKAQVGKQKNKKANATLERGLIEEIDVKEFIDGLHDEEGNPISTELKTKWEQSIKYNGLASVKDGLMVMVVLPEPNN